MFQSLGLFKENSECILLLLFLAFSVLVANSKKLLKVAVNTIVPQSPFFAFCTPKHRLLQT